MPNELPEVNREYRNHHLDSLRWNAYQPREGDIVVTTSYKSGTTWTQQIVHYLIFRGDPEAQPMMLTSPWIDARFHGPLDEVIANVEAQEHRRCLKSHLPLDGLPFHPQVRYIVVGRDARDVFMSLWNHYSNYTEDVMGRLNGGDDFVGEKLPQPPQSGTKALRELWRSWMTRGWFPWEQEGWPYWGNLHHTATYWPWRHLDNILFVHYSDLLADPHGQIARIASFIGEDLTTDEIGGAVAHSTIDNMRESWKPFDEGFRTGFKGGVESFVYKGTNGRWKDVLDDDDLALYEDAKRRLLAPECAEWLTHGSLASSAAGS